MKIIIFIILCKISFLSIGQHSVYLSELSTTFYSVDSMVLIRKGNMVNMDNRITKKILLNNFEIFSIDKKGIRNYFFIASAKNPHGTLIEDKLRNRTLYFDRELILVKDNNNAILILEITNKCGIDIFTLKKCGFTDACYDFKNGILFFNKTNIIFHQKHKMMLNILSCKLKKTSNRPRL